MTDTDVIAALTALRDAGLVTDPHRLNCAWADLTGNPRPDAPTPRTENPTHG
jgi:hypothetical protein